MMRLTHLTPMLESTDLRATLQFYTELLGFTCTGVYPDAEQPCWLSLRSGDVTLMFANRNEHRREFAEAAQPILTGSLYFNPVDVVALWEQLKDKVVVEYPLAAFDYGMREFAIRDCNGYLLQFGQEAPAADQPTANNHD
jgi:uncharacterized glyoxalase superfamily protein PhnB